MSIRGNKTLLPRPTPAGWAFLSLWIVLVFAGIQSHKNLLILAGCLGLGAFLACFFLCWANLRNLFVQRQIPFPLFAGATFRFTLTIVNPRPFLPAFLVMVLDQVEGTGAAKGQFFSGVRFIPKRGMKAAETPGRFHKFGQKEFRALKLFSTFPLGLFQMKRFVILEEKVVVYPRIRPLDRSLLPRKSAFQYAEIVPLPAAKGTEEIAGLREFRSGDNPKWIHWKASARLESRLLIKEFEGISIQRVDILFDPRMGKGLLHPLRSFERAVNFAASLVYALKRQHTLIDFRILGEETKRFLIFPTGGSLFSLFHELALLEPLYGKGDGKREIRGLSRVPRLLIRPADFTPVAPLHRILQWT